MFSVIIDGQIKLYAILWITALGGLLFRKILKYCCYCSKDKIGLELPIFLQ